LLNPIGTTRGTPLQVLQVGPDFSQLIAPEAICQNVTVKQDWGFGMILLAGYWETLSLKTTQLEGFFTKTQKIFPLRLVQRR